MKHNHNIILKKLSYLLLSFAFAISIVGCEPVESVPDDSGIVIKDIAGTWVVDMAWDGAAQGTNTISIYNTADNDATMWLDDIQHGWGLKSKVPVNLETLTFDASDLEELYYDVTVSITESIIIKNGATAPSGTVVDSIYFKAEFSDIPGEIWEYAGYKSTAMIEDLP